MRDCLVKKNTFSKINLKLYSSFSVGNSEKKIKSGDTDVDKSIPLTFKNRASYI
jgi:hypothetical protein